MAGCIGYCILALGGAVLLGVDDANVPDVIFIAGLLILCVAGPLLLFFMLRLPEVRNEFVGTHAQQGRGCAVSGLTGPASRSNCVPQSNQP
jgi:hypothetical protein